jgi:hypothetical protein
MATKNVSYRFFFILKKINSNRYKSGMLDTDKNEVLKNNENEREMSRLINETTTSILRIYNAYGAEAIEDWEVNELLEWTHSLNYDEYLLDWRTIGTSGSSNVIYGLMIMMKFWFFLKKEFFL